MGLMVNDIEVFRTNIENLNGADRFKKELSVLYPSSKISFDLEDCDRILRIETHYDINTNQIIALGHHLGVLIELLED
jgi:hypothetical protein